MNTDAAESIVLIHGLWMTPRSWDSWAERFRASGHDVRVPGWPGIDDRSVADIRRNPAPLEGLGIRQITDHYAEICKSLISVPIIMGHSFGGLITALLADRGIGAAYVAIAPAATAGVGKTPLSTLRSALPILANPFGKHGAKPLSKRHFHYTFGNDLPAPSRIGCGSSRRSTPPTGSCSKRFRRHATRRMASRESTTHDLIVLPSSSSPASSTTSHPLRSAGRRSRSIARRAALPSSSSGSTPAERTGS